MCYNFFVDKTEIRKVVNNGQKAARQILGNQKKQAELIADVKNLVGDNRRSSSDYWQSITVLLSLLQDYFKGEYDRIPMKSVLLVISSFLYILSPTRILPDWVPLGAFLERTFISVLVLELIKDDLVAYSEWKAIGVG